MSETRLFENEQVAAGVAFCRVAGWQSAALWSVPNDTNDYWCRW